MAVVEQLDLVEELGNPLDLVHEHALVLPPRCENGAREGFGIAGESKPLAPLLEVEQQVCGPLEHLKQGRLPRLAGPEYQPHLPS
jgi:hypothetical protein